MFGMCVYLLAAVVCARSAAAPFWLVLGFREKIKIIHQILAFAQSFCFSASLLGTSNSMFAIILFPFNLISRDMIDLSNNKRTLGRIDGGRYHQ